VWLRHTFTDALHCTFSGDDEVTRAIRRGVFLHWRGSDRARRKTMALLAGDDQRLVTFLTQYAAVTSHAMTAGAPSGFPRAVRTRVGLVERSLHVIWTALNRRSHTLAASLRARGVLPEARHQRSARAIGKERAGI
jgi:hypothetical protein